MDAEIFKQHEDGAKVLNGGLVLGDQLVQTPQIMRSLHRSLLGGPRREFLRGLGIEGTSFYFEQDGLVAERHDGMPRSRGQFNARRHVAKQLRTEHADLLRISMIVEYDERELPFYREQRFGLRVERMPVRAYVAIGPYCVEQTLAGILIALVNIQVLSLPRRLLRCGSQVV